MRIRLNLLAAILQGSLSISIITDIHAAEWQEVNTENTCTKRHETAMAGLDGKLYLIGGRGWKPVEEYDPATNRWRELSKTPIIIHHFQPVVVGNRVALIGAMTGGYPKEPSVENLWWFEPAKDEWTKGPNLPEGRARGGAGAVVHENKLYLIGGNTSGHWNGFVPWLDVLDLETNQWTSLPDAPHARDHFNAAIIDGKIIAAGGRRSYAEIKQTFNLTVPEVDVYDIKTGKWTTLANNIPTPRAGCMTVSRNGIMIVIGGESGTHSAGHAEVEALSLEQGTWSAWPNLKQGRHSGGVAFAGDDLYIAAGSGNRGGGPELNSLEKMKWPSNAAPLGK